MNFQDANIELKNGKKIRRKNWQKDLFLLKEEEKIHAYGEECVPFQYDLSILDSGEWIMLEDNDRDKKYTFSEVIELLLQGKKMALTTWEESIYLEVEKHDKTNLYMRKLIKYNFVPTFACLISNDWEII
jgi:hypothetical protein